MNSKKWLLANSTLMIILSVISMVLSFIVLMIGQIWIAPILFTISLAIFLKFTIFRKEIEANQNKPNQDIPDKIIDHENMIDFHARLGWDLLLNKSRIINLRGRVIPVIDLRKKLELESKEYNKETRIIVVDINGKTVGFIVDEVNEVLRISKSVTETPPELVGGVKAEYITAVGKLDDRLIILLDLDKILSHEEQLELN